MATVWRGAELGSIYGRCLGLVSELRMDVGFKLPLGMDSISLRTLDVAQRLRLVLASGVLDDVAAGTCGGRSSACLASSRNSSRAGTREAHHGHCEPT